MTPLDHPTPDRPHRRYVALTNHCNRSCPWCSTCSSPAGSTFLSREAFAGLLPDGPFELQLEGGEPTVHPRFWEFVRLARARPECRRIVLCTNGVRLPRRRDRLRAWLARLGTPVTVKLSYNHHLRDRDPGLLDLARLVREELDGLFVLNVRLRPGRDEDVHEAVARAGLLDVANVFRLQAYGFAKDEPWDPPAPVWSAFSLVNPDGALFGPDLVARSEAMRRLR